VVSLLAVTAATLLFGVAGAVVAVPVVAVGYQVAEYLRTARTAAAEDPVGPLPATTPPPWRPPRREGYVTGPSVSRAVGW
jgi:hypothetical protein